MMLPGRGLQLEEHLLPQLQARGQAGYLTSVAADMPAALDKDFLKSYAQEAEKEQSLKLNPMHPEGILGVGDRAADIRQSQGCRGIAAGSKAQDGLLGCRQPFKPSSWFMQCCPDCLT